MAGCGKQKIYTDIIKFLDFINKNNRRKFDRFELADRFGLSPATVTDWIEKLEKQELICVDRGCGKAKSYFYSLDYFVPDEYIGEIAPPRTSISKREWKPSKTMLERIDLTRTIKTLASNVLCPENTYVMTGVRMFK